MDKNSLNMDTPSPPYPEASISGLYNGRTEEVSFLTIGPGNKHLQTSCVLAKEMLLIRTLHVHHIQKLQYLGYILGQKK